MTGNNGKPLQRNIEVVKAWGRREEAYAAHLYSPDGRQLYSYALLIGEWRDGTPVVFNYTAKDDTNPFGHKVPSLGFRSMTTSHHVGLARRVGYAFQK